MPQNNNNEMPLSTPFNNIALTFSGGGFRAAAFSLGALSYLNRLEIPGKTKEDGGRIMLKNVSFISSTSGGSFTNALYSSYIHSGKSFTDVYHKLAKDMAGQYLLEEVFSILNDDAQWDQPGNGKHRNIINAFAKAYDKIIFEKETFGVFWNKDHVPAFEVCFNSTDFYRGLSFRFQSEGTDNPKQVIGNNYLHFNTKELDTVKKIKIADMVAASSCFPAGFEPIVYPNDFSYRQDGNALTVDDLKKGMLFENYQEAVSEIKTPYGFMDGGITDNQGLYSAMLADKKRRRRAAPDPFDLIIVTDVASYFMDEYQVPAEETKPEWRNKTINYFAGKIKGGIRAFSKFFRWPVIILIVLFLGSIASMVFSTGTALTIAGGILCGATAAVLLLLYVVRTAAPVKWLLKNKNAIEQDVYVKKMAREQKFISEKTMNLLIHFLQYARISLLEQMIKARISSMLSMLLDINLKQTRRLIYEMFYNDPAWDNRRMPNFIYELSTYNVVSRTNRFNSESRLKWKATDADKILLLHNCEALNKVAEDARTMGTTLWFDEKDEKRQMLKKIITAGQFTTCCNLLEYIISMERKGIAFEKEVTEQLAVIKATLTSDFLQFKEDPYYLYDMS